jgi:predicted NACHT family NTPase
VQEIRNFSSKFHANHFVLTCRIATCEYTFEQFTDVEVTDFDNSQIATFVNKWFAAKDPIKHKKLIQKLIQNPRIQELATNPLLLTLLCLMFEESTDFPLNRSELYEEGLNVLLKKWDAKRNIERKQVYKNLCVQHKVDLLSQIAFKTFERGDYFFRQRELEQHIADYIVTYLVSVPRLRHCNSTATQC